MHILVVSFASDVFVAMESRASIQKLHGVVQDAQYLLIQVIGCCIHLQDSTFEHQYISAISSHT